MNSNKNTHKGLYIKNFGCQMNVYDGDRMQEMMSPLHLLERKKYLIKKEKVTVLL